jgi:hypothetical protein
MRWYNPLIYAGATAAAAALLTENRSPPRGLGVLRWRWSQC